MRPVHTLLRGRRPLPRLAGRYEGRKLLVLGSADTLWDDLAGFDEAWDGDRMAINLTGAFYPGRIEHWASLHPELMGGFVKYRLRAVDSREFYMHAQKPHPDLPGLLVWDLTNLGATSGLFACFVGLLLGYENIVLAGVPMTSTGHFFGKPGFVKITDYGASHYDAVWLEAADRYFEDRVRSLSGRTRDWLGAP